MNMRIVYRKENWKTCLAKSLHFIFLSTDVIELDLVMSIVGIHVEKALISQFNCMTGIFCSFLLLLLLFFSHHILRKLHEPSQKVQTKNSSRFTTKRRICFAETCLRIRLKQRGPKLFPFFLAYEFLKVKTIVILFFSRL